MFEVESERQVRGAVERRCRLSPEGARISPDDAKGMSLEDHRSGFAAAMASLIAEFNVYLDQRGAEPTADGVSYRQFTVWMNPKERARLTQEFVRLILPLMENSPGAGRAPYLLSSIMFHDSSNRASAGPEAQKPKRRARKR